MKSMKTNLPKKFALTVACQILIFASIPSLAATYVGDYRDGLCHPVDRAGVPFGQPVNDKLCATGYYAGDYRDGLCHPLDRAGVPYGRPVNDSKCASGSYASDYRDGLCHPLDRAGVPFGHAVQDSYCE